MNGTQPTARKEKILSLIVENYIATGEPVGSKSLTNETGLKVSSATVRNDMAELTSQGYIAQPHTSAGRIPTAKGFRHYVDNSMTLTPVSRQGRAYIQDKLALKADSPESVLRCAADLLSSLTDYVALSTTPSSSDSRIRRLCFVQTGAHAAMVVLIASNGVIKTRLFRCEFLLTPEILSVFDKALNDAFAGIRLCAVNRPLIQTVASGFGELALLMPAALTAIMDAARQAENVSVCHSGYNKLMHVSPQSFEAARAVLEFLQNERDLALMLEKLPSESGAVIGNENSRVELSHSSVIFSRYTIEGNPSGALAVIGPLRMNYARNISIINCVAECVSEQLTALIEP